MLSANNDSSSPLSIVKTLDDRSSLKLLDDEAKAKAARKARAQAKLDEDAQAKASANAERAAAAKAKVDDAAAKKEAQSKALEAKAFADAKVWCCFSFV